MRIGYAPISHSLDSPGDRRRFIHYANKRSLRYEIADPLKKYDLVVITQNADLSIWSQYDRDTTKIVYDLIDSYLAIPKTNIKGWLRGLAKYFSGRSRRLQINHWKAISGMCSRADAVVCSTKEQQAEITRFCSNVHIVLDSHTSVARKIKTNYRSHRPFRLVWEGLPHTLGGLKVLVRVLETLREHYPVELHLVTDSFYKRFLGKYYEVNTLAAVQKYLPSVHFHEWNEDSFADIICSCDLAVIPLNLNDPFAAGKPENKLLLLWRMAMPVVTSASPAYMRAMHAAGMNYAAKDGADWVDILSHLIRDEAARRQAGIMGKAYVESEFSETTLLTRWDSVFESLGFCLKKPFNSP